jgi:hypothetical protein
MEYSRGSVLGLSTNDLGQTVSINAYVDISFGLTIVASLAVFLWTAMGVTMENLNGVLRASVSGGAAFLRSHGGKISAQTRDKTCVASDASKSERGRFDSSPPHQFLKSLS